LDETQLKATVSIVQKLYQVYRQYDADLVEINPLALTTAGGIIALDAKVIINDNALFRQQRFKKSRERYDNELEYRASQYNLNYVKLQGNIGLLCTGAGLTLATVDLITDSGGAAANFLESGGANYANTYRGLQLVLSDPDVKVLLINTFGLVSRADVICRGLADGLKELKPEIPIVACIRGTGEEEARRIFREEYGIEPFEHMDEAILEAIKLAG
jgi:succinyl-CoA synthetase beta subunit